GSAPLLGRDWFDAAHLVKSLFTSSSVHVSVLTAPSSRRTFSASSRVVGASTLKWFAPRTGRKCTLGLVELRAMVCKASRLPWAVPSTTSTGPWIGSGKPRGDRSSSRGGFEVSNGRYSGPSPATSSAGPKEKPARKRSEHSATRRTRVPPVL